MINVIVKNLDPWLGTYYVDVCDLDHARGGRTE